MQNFPLSAAIILIVAIVGTFSYQVYLERTGPNRIEILISQAGLAVKNR